MFGVGLIIMVGLSLLFNIVISIIELCSAIKGVCKKKKKSDGENGSEVEDIKVEKPKKNTVAPFMA